MSLPEAKPNPAGVLRQRGGEVVSRLNHLDAPMGAEVGVWRGALAQCVLQELPQLTWLMVDPWIAGAYREVHDSISHCSQAEFDVAYRDAMQRTEFAADRRIVFRLPSVEAAKQVPDESLDLVFIDGDHHDDAVSADVRAWYPKVKPGGWIGGHDWRPPTQTTGWHVGPAVTRTLSDMGVEPAVTLGADKTWWLQKVMT